MNPKVSVMTVTYNHRQFLRETVDSALGQITDFQIEMLVADDASTDGAPDLLAELAEEYGPRLKPIQRTKNLGMAENFLTTIDACTGEYVAFLDGDDRWTDDHKLQKQIDLLDVHPEASLCFHRTRNIGDDPAFKNFDYPIDPKTEWTREDLLRANVMNTSSVVYRRSMIPPYPSWLRDLKSQDWSLHLLVSAKGPLLYVPETMADYRVHAGGTWSRMRELDKVESEAAMFRAIENDLDGSEKAIANQSLCSRLFTLASLKLAEGNRDAAKVSFNELRNRGAVGISTASMLKLKSKFLIPGLGAASSRLKSRR